MSLPLRFRRPLRPPGAAASAVRSLPGASPARGEESAAGALGAQAGFVAQLHPLHRQFLAYREGLGEGRPHSLEETAEHFGIDPATARLTDEYLRTRFRLYVDRAGWRAGQVTGW